MSIFNLSNKSEKAKTKPTTPGTKAADARKRVHNLIIVDESGSMQAIYRPALTGINETLQTIRDAQKEHPEQSHFVSLITFDSGHYNRIYRDTVAEMAINITPEYYRPRGRTPLYDAMGRSIHELLPKVDDSDVVLVTVITDGYENASCEYNALAIKSLVEELKEKGWVFTYIGANQNVEAVASSMSIDNHLAFDADEESTTAMFEFEKGARKKFFSKINDDTIPKCDLGMGYFDPDDENSKDPLPF